LLGLGLAAGALALGPVSMATAQGDENPAEKAAREIEEAQERANAAATAYFDAESQIDQLDLKAQRLERERAALAADVDLLRGDVSELAVEQFVASASGGIPLLSDPAGPFQQRQAEVMRSVALDVSSSDLDAYDEARRRLEAKEQEIEDTTDELETAKVNHRALEQQALAEVEHLKEVEEQRLKDEAVRAELERQRAERQRALEEQIREQQAARERQQEALRQRATQPAPPPAVPADPAADPTTPPAAQPDGPDAASPPSDTSPDPVPDPAPDPTLPPAPDPTTPPAPPVPPPPPPAPPPDFVPGLVCPVNGPSAYADTFGAPRSGGRFHEGVDMIAAAGTPLVAVTGGYAEMRPSSLGGNSVRLHAPNGDYYFYAHLSAYEGSSRDVGQGEVIGYVGHTGNTSTDHLHFEVHPGGGPAINPYPTVVAAGC
jgi:murein DD-endopeptidase MepM/ murein hydrolase activator NlpD